MKKLIFTLCALTLSTMVSAQKNIVETILKDKNSFYYLDFNQYKQQNKIDFPIGVFDSGTGGLTVLEAILNYDQNGTTTGADGKPDFANETFTYLGDQANMPYGNYSKENKTDLLQEHIIKDAQFLLSNKFYPNRSAKNYLTSKKPVKALVIACNTATAYGKKYIEEFLAKADSDIKVIGVIDAGARGAVDLIQKDENAIVGVLATVGTVSSKGYKKSILREKDARKYTGNIEVVQQGGIGIAESIDEDKDYYDRNLKTARTGYKGPSLAGSVKIDKALFDVYNFDESDFKMLCKTTGKGAKDCSELQINDPENYVRFHLVSMMEKIRRSNTNNKLKSIILGCTHYPYMQTEIKKILNELYTYKRNGIPVYRQFMEKDIKLIDPSYNTAKELYTYLASQKMFSKTGSNAKSTMYISVPNDDNPNIKKDADGRFTYDYKYGRTANENQEYVKVVPFKESGISKEVIDRLKEKTPKVYSILNI